MPASGRHYREISPALRLHLQRLEQAVDALPRFPWETLDR